MAIGEPTTNLADLTQYVKDLIEVGKDALGVHSVYYGDQAKIPFTPTVCVEAGEKRNELNGAPRRMMVSMTIYVLVYHSKVTSTSVNRKADDQMAEAIEDLLHLNADLEGRVIDSSISAIEFGFQMRDNTLFRASRLTLEARQQVQLPSSA